MPKAVGVDGPSVEDQERQGEKGERRDELFPQGINLSLWYPSERSANLARSGGFRKKRDSPKWCSNLAEGVQRKPPKKQVVIPRESQSLVYPIIRSLAIKIATNP